MIVVAGSIAAIAAGVALIGSTLTRAGLAWYETLTLPSFTPTGATIGTIWTVIYILAALSAVLTWGSLELERRRYVMALFFINAALNVLWSYIFFTVHALGLALIEMTLLNISTLLLIILLWRRARLASLLLFPYFVWVSFATYLAFLIWQLNT